MERRGLMRSWLGAERIRRAPVGGPGAGAVIAARAAGGLAGRQTESQVTVGGPGARGGNVRRMGRTLRGSGRAPAVRPLLRRGLPAADAADSGGTP